MDKLVFLIQDVSDPRIGAANSFSDRLSCRFTVSVLGVFALVITTRQYVGEPISCWCPLFFSNTNVDYTNKVCWTIGTYFLEFNISNIPSENDPRRLVSYYQWVSVFLVVQSLLFYMPQLIWRTFNRKSGIAVHTLTDLAIERQKKTDKDCADRMMAYLVKQMGRFLVALSRDATNSTNKFKQFWLTVYGNYLICLYLFIKIIYIANAFGQIYLINAFLGSSNMATGYHMYGYEVLWKLVHGENWTTSDRFPRVTLCDFKIRVLGHVNRHTVQCALPMNLLNEIFFIFIWFWLMMVGCCTVVSLFSWIFLSLPKSQVNFIRNRLVAMDKVKTNKTKVKARSEIKTNCSEVKLKNEVKVERFVSDYLRRDGCFIIRLVLDNTSDHIAAELIAGLFEHYKENRKRIDKMLEDQVKPLLGVASDSQTHDKSDSEQGCATKLA